MLRKLSLALAGTLFVAAAAAAATPTFPSSVTDAGPNYPAPTAAVPRFANTTADRAVQTPSSVSESMPEMTGGLDHPTMGKGATRDTRGARDGGYPSSVNETMPEMTGGQSHPTMGR